MGTYGEGNWSQIAWQFAGRIGKQCRERWHNQLRPNIKRDAWTNEEEERFIAAHRGLGNRCVVSPLSQPCSSRGVGPGLRPTLPLVVVLRVASSATVSLDWYTCHQDLWLCAPVAKHVQSKRHAQSKLVSGQLLLACICTAQPGTNGLPNVAQVGIKTPCGTWFLQVGGHRQAPARAY